jgi:rhodanese-related sulfurtransferase
MATKDPREPFTRISVLEASEMTKNGRVQFVDVREPHEYQAGHAPRAINIPHMAVFARRDELDAHKEIVFICQVGQRSALACEFAAAAGLSRLYNVEGGTDDWVKHGLPIES